MPDDNFSAPARSTCYQQHKVQGPPLSTPVVDMWKLDVFCAQPPLEKSVRQPQPVSDAHETTLMAEKITVASKEFVSALRNLFSGDKEAALRRMERSLKLLSEIRLAVAENSFGGDDDFSIVILDALEKAIRDNEASLGHAEEGETSLAVKKVYEGHCHLEGLLSVLI